MDLRFQWSELEPPTLKSKEKEENKQIIVQHRNTKNWGRPKNII